MSDNNKTMEFEAAAFRKLLEHLQKHTEVQNIELMILADFCRNCLAKWYVEGAKQQGADIDYEAAREIVYGMPYQEWKEKFQQPATEAQMKAYQEKQAQKNNPSS